MVTDGARFRLAIYWIEPRLVRETDYFTTSCDLLLTEDAIHYWIPGMAEPATLGSTEYSGDRLLPSDDDVRSMLRSALAIVRDVQYTGEPASSPLNLHCFLEDSRRETEHICEYLPGETEDIDLFSDTATDRQILNAMPLGREYKKKVADDGAMIWQMKRVLDNRFVIGVTVKPMDDVQGDVDSHPFDVTTLGRWERVPESCRLYWTLRSDYLALDESTDTAPQACDMCNRIESYLASHEMADRVRRGMEYLWVEAALAAKDLDRVNHALEAMTTGLCQDDGTNCDHAFLELARLADEVAETYPEQFQRLVGPNVQRLVEDAGPYATESFDRVIVSIASNKWYAYGDLIVEAMRREPLPDATTVEAVATKYEATHLAAQKAPFDLSQSSTTVQRYLAQFEIGPPKGDLGMNDIRLILEAGLVLPEEEDSAKKKAQIAEDTLTLVRWIAGQGPFRSDRARLRDAIEQFSRTYHCVSRNAEPIQPALATFLALAFYDTSTCKDHEELCAQVGRIATELETRLNDRLAAWKLSDLVTPDDVKGVITKYCQEEFRRFVDDPLCPTFKFPLTTNEQVRLTNKLKPDFDRLEPFLEEMSLKVKYGGLSPRLKDKSVQRISRAVQSLLSATAFMRRPSYVGLTYQYRGRYGFTCIVPEAAYRDEHQARQEFKAMRYFHLGHRLANN